MMKKRNEREKKRMKMVTKSKGIALGTRSQNYMAKVPPIPLDLTQSHQRTNLGRSLGMLMGSLFD
jgi:hypothetical protein